MPGLMQRGISFFFKLWDSSRIVSLFFVLGICASLFILYLPLASHFFLNLDDPIYVAANPHVLTGLSFDNIVWAFTTFHAEFWHPLTWLSYMLDTTLFGVHPGGYLFTNLLLHTLNTIFLFYALRAMTGDFWASAMVAIIFGVHPLHVESVAWIAERKELLSGFFFMSCLCLYPSYTRGKKLIRYVLLCVFFACGIMAKPMIITLPFVMLLLDFWPLQRLMPENLSSKKAVLIFMEKIPLFILSAFGAVITIMAQNQGGGIVPTSEYSLAARLSNAILSYIRYIQKILYPIDLSVFYPFPRSIPIVDILFCAILLLFITFVCILAMRRYPYLLVGWLWFTGMLVPVLGIVKFGDFAMADRFAYLPLTGVLVMIVFGTRKRAVKSCFGKFIFASIFLIVAASFFRLTSIQIGYWKDSETLYLHALSVTRQNFLAYNGLGNTYAEYGLSDNAIYNFMQAVNIRPDKATLWNSLGRAFVMKGFWGRAKKSFAQAMFRRPDDPQGYYLMGCALTYEEAYERAGYFFSQSLKKYLRMKKCAIGMKSPAESQMDSPIVFKNSDRPQKAYDDIMDKDKICGLASLIAKADRLRISGQFKKSIEIYCMTEDKKRINDMVIAGYDYWIKTLIMSSVE